MPHATEPEDMCKNYRYISPFMVVDVLLYSRFGSVIVCSYTLQFLCNNPLKQIIYNALCSSINVQSEVYNFYEI